MRAAAVTAAAIAFAAVAVPRWNHALMPATSDTAVAWTLLLVAVSLLAQGAQRLAHLIGLAGATWILVGLAPFLPAPAVDSVERLSLVPHALLVIAVLALPAGRLTPPRRWLAVAALVTAAIAGAGAYGHALLVLGLLALVGCAGGDHGSHDRARVLATGGGLGAGLAIVGITPGVVAQPSAATTANALAATLIVSAVAVYVVATTHRSARGHFDGIDLGGGEVLGLTLGSALGVPSLGVVFPTAGAGFIDPSGRSVPAPGDATTVRDSAGAVVALLSPVVAISPSAGAPLRQLLAIAADGARLRAAGRERAREIAASRSRLLGAGDAERHQLEQQLHQGAISRLERVSAVLAGSSGSSSLARRSVRTREELLRIARGLGPPTRSRGLRAVIAELSKQSRLPVDLDLDLGGEPSNSAARAAWFTCAEALANVAKHAPGATVTIHASLADEQLTVRVSDDGPGGAVATGSGLRGLADRAATLGGSLDVESDARGTRLVLVVPAAGNRVAEVGPALYSETSPRPTVAS